MRSEGFPFRGLGVGGVFARLGFADRNRPQPSAMLPNRPAVGESSCIVKYMKVWCHVGNVTCFVAPAQGFVNVTCFRRNYVGNCSFTVALFRC